MRTRHWLSTALAASALSLAACGEPDDSSNNGTQNNQSSDFACGDSLTCTSGEFCLRERYPNAEDGDYNNTECIDLPSSCNGCDCAQDAAVASFDGANNCDGFKACSQSNSAITVTCTNPGVGF